MPNGRKITIFLLLKSFRRATWDYDAIAILAIIFSPCGPVVEKQKLKRKSASFQLSFLGQLTKFGIKFLFGPLSKFAQSSILMASICRVDRVSTIRNTGRIRGFVCRCY